MDAVADLQDGLNLKSSDAYAVLWLHLAKKNTGQNDSQSFAQQASQIDHSKWPAPIAGLFLDQLTPEQTLSAARNPDPVKDREQHCEAQFYIGEYFLLRKKKSKALVHFRTARDMCPHNFVEYDGAAAELVRLGAKAPSANK